MNFSYTAKSTTGAVSTGVIDAASPAEARRLLRERSLFAMALQAKGGANGRAATKSVASVGTTKSSTAGRIRKTDLLMFTTQLSIMCRSGVDLAEAFKNVAADCPKPALRDVINSIYADVAAGSSVSVALQRRSDVFGEAYVASMAAGEASGRVNEVLEQLAELLKNEIKLQNTLRSVLAYPIVLMFVAAIVVTALVFFVLPQFGKVFETLETSPPAMTQNLLIGSAAVRAHWPWVLGFLGCCVVAGRWYLRTEESRRLLDRMLLNNRFLRTATRPLLTGRSFRLIGTMLQSGLPLLEAIQLAARSTSNLHFKQVFVDMESEILLGHGITGALRSTDVVPSGAVQLVATAERTGNLGSVMQLVGEYYEDEGEREIRQRAKILEPLIIVAMGGIVAFVVSSVMLPLLDVSTATGH